MAYFLKNNISVVNVLTDGIHTKTIDGDGHQRVVGPNLFCLRYISDSQNRISFDDIQDNDIPDQDDTNMDEDYELMILNKVYIGINMDGDIKSYEGINDKKTNCLYNKTMATQLDTLIKTDDMGFPLETYLLLGVSITVENDSNSTIIRFYRMNPGQLNTYTVKAGERFYYGYVEFGNITDPYKDITEASFSLVMENGKTITYAFENNRIRTSEESMDDYVIGGVSLSNDVISIPTN